jgi:8-oxo-dGTP diphosphatase
VESQVIQAAGAVLWRRLSDELIQVALIHRPRYDDWSFPKGKVEAGESEISCAFREVLEETGYETVFGPELCRVEYQVNQSTKTVRY